MDVSVVVPVYNTEKYLRPFMESVLSQTHKSFEVILVDDGSKDKSGEICDEYAKNNPNVRVIHKKNGGNGYARNECQCAAVGE
ncbi:MAG: glycosyltransferase [Eubacterium sp.]|nr:glycosyltransferase [Eubacterium sp.]